MDRIEYPVPSSDKIPNSSHTNDSSTHNLTINELRVVNINFQSIMNKKADLQEFIYSHKPHIIVATETWLSAGVSNNEVIPAEWNYNVYRKDRPDGYYGGVMIAISKLIPSYEMTALQTECELLWIQVVVGILLKLRWS